MTQYNTETIFKLLVAAFRPVELWRLCRDKPFLQPVFQEVNRDMSIDDIADAVIDCCRRHVTFDELLETIRSVRERQFRRYEKFIKISDDQPALFSRAMVMDADLSDLLSQLKEWKLVHNNSQELLNSLNIPLDYLTTCRFRPDNATLDQAGSKWQELCVPKLRSVPDKWDLRYIYSPVLSDLRYQTSNIDDITRQLMQTDVDVIEARERVDFLYLQIVEIRGTIWDVLTVADKSIMVLVETMQRVIGR